MTTTRRAPSLHRIALRWLAAPACVLLVAACSQPADTAWSGYVEGEYVYVSSPISGSLTALSVKRGDAVERGTPLFTLDAQAERAAREEAAARASGAAAQAADLAKGKRDQEIAVVQAQLAQAKAQAVQATAELHRQEQLVTQGFVSASRLDDVRAAARQANAHVAELEAQLRVAQLPARSDERNAAAATTEAAKKAVEQARWREDQMQQSAPSGARVADTFFRQGEWVGAGQPVVSLLPPGAVKARFFVPEGELGAIAIGQPVSMQCDGCGAPIAARITFIATQAEYTPPVIYSNSQRSRLVFMVEARPEAASETRLRPGQPIDVRRTKP